jgi:outer membrane protein
MNRPFISTAFLLLALGLIPYSVSYSQSQGSTNLIGSQGSVSVTPANNTIFPKMLSTQNLTKLELPPQFAIPILPSGSNLVDVKNDRLNDGRVMDLIGLYQEAAFNAPVINNARFNLTARKELFWQGLSVLLPQVSANPTGTRFFSTARVLTVFLIKRATP